MAYPLLSVSYLSTLAKIDRRIRAGKKATAPVFGVVAKSVEGPKGFLCG